MNNRVFVTLNLMISMMIPAAVALAGTLPVGKAKVDGEVIRMNGDFGWNAKLGRAWIEVTYEEDGHYEYEHTGRARFLVEGLSYDHGSILFDDGTRQVICAVVKRGKIIPLKSVKKTGHCDILTQRIVEKVDNGFEIRSQNYINVSLRVQ